MIFKKDITVRWSDIDHNQHVRHSAYYDYGAVVRIAFFESIGYTMNRLSELNLGPILFKEGCSFFGEIKLNEVITIDMKRGDISEDGSKWSFYHDIHTSDGKLAAQITVQGAWMDTEKRRITNPPEDLNEAFLNLEKGEQFTYKTTQ